MSEKSQEQKVRKQLEAQGYKLQKRTNNTNPYNGGGYRIINAYNNSIEAGENYDLSLEDVEAFIAE